MYIPDSGAANGVWGESAAPSDIQGLFFDFLAGATAAQRGRTNRGDLAKKAENAALLYEKTNGWPLVDRAILFAIAEFESGFNASAKNSRSSAHGVFQIVDGTWAALGFRSAPRGNVHAQLDAGIRLYQENLRSIPLSDSLAPAAKLITMYTLHHDGRSGKDYGGRVLAERHVLPIFRRYLRLFGELTRAGLP